MHRCSFWLFIFDPYDAEWCLLANFKYISKCIIKILWGKSFIFFIWLFFFFRGNAVLKRPFFYDCFFLENVVLKHPFLVKITYCFIFTLEKKGSEKQYNFKKLTRLGVEKVRRRGSSYGNYTSLLNPS